MEESKKAVAERVPSLGATLLTAAETQFQVWAPDSKKVVALIVEREGDQEIILDEIPLARDADGVFIGTAEDCRAGTLYRYQLDGRPGRPDPYSRFQPFGVHGPSEVIDPKRFEWNDDDWLGIAKRDLIVYELHVGSFTEPGTYLAAIAKISELAKLGITAIELLPLAQTPGRWNWGYDGVNFFAPRNTYGTPDDLRALVDACHAAGLAVIHDVVYNHVGPEGNYLSEFGPYRSTKHGTPWGDSLNFDGPHCQWVREFVIANVLYWIDEFHFDGLRLDAIHYIFDTSADSIVHEIRRRFRQHAQTLERQVMLIAESNIYDPELLHDADGQLSSYDAIWSDCLMHSIYSHGNPEVRLTNRKYVGTADLAESLEHAYIFSAPQAFRVKDQDRKKHHPDGDRNYVRSLVMALQTHDSVGNHPHGKRLHQLTNLQFHKAAAPLVLLYPSIPMIFMGEEWATEAPFPFFADFEDPRLRAAVDRGRRDEYPHHDWEGSPLPSDPQAFYSSKSKSTDLHPEMWQWYQQLLKLRKQGLSDGWLDTHKMSTQHDPTLDVFWLMFSLPDKKILVCSRLASHDMGDITIELGKSATILLSSEKKVEKKQPESLTLAPCQCIIWSEAIG